MEILRRNTDYALRLIAVLAEHFETGAVISARRLARDCKIPYELGRKLLQKLQRAQLVQARQGAQGGFSLSRRPSEITLMEVIGALQGGLFLNRCLLAESSCELQSDCAISRKLSPLQQHIQQYLSDITIEEVTAGPGPETSPRKQPIPA